MFLPCSLANRFFSGKIGIDRIVPGIQTLIVTGKQQHLYLPKTEIPEKIIFSSATDSNTHHRYLNFLYHPKTTMVLFLSRVSVYEYCRFPDKKLNDAYQIYLYQGYYQQLITIDGKRDYIIPLDYQQWNYLNTRTEQLIAEDDRNRTRQI